MSIIITTAYDAAEPHNIPSDPEAVLPYSDGEFAWSRLEFPDALYRYITVTGDPDADIADFEPGAIWPASNLRDWAQARMARHPGYDLTVYTDRVNFNAAKDAMVGFTWHLFLATQDGTAPRTWEGMATRAVQTRTKAKRYDVSTVFDAEWLNKP